jgi:hypothetical protein
MERDLRRNPGLLKLELFCRGLRLDESCARLDRDGRPLLRTRAGLGSGLELVLPTGLWVNAPTLEAFAQRSPFLLVHRGGRYFIERDGAEIAPVVVPPAPRFYERRTASGRLMSRVGVLQGTYLGVYPTSVCAHWLAQPAVNCAFCTVGLNLGPHEEREKSVADVVETALAARAETGITFVHFNTGYAPGDSCLGELEPFVRAVKRETGLLVGVQTPPQPDLSRYRALRKLGVNQVSFCFEFWRRETLERHCPGKAKAPGLDAYLDAIRYCAPLFDTTNGEIIAGLEPIDATLEAIEWITDQRAIPTVCVFRPLIGSRLEHESSPDPEPLIPVFRRLYEACIEKGLPIGIAPNLEVSIILKPEECRWFAEAPERPLRRAKHFFMRQALVGLLAVQTTVARARRAVRRGPA